MRKVAFAIVCAACLLSPALIGGVLPLWTPALALLGALGCALLGRCAPAGPDLRLLAILAIPIAAAALQLIPLPAAAVATLSPRAAQLRPGAGPLTLDVPGTVFELGRAAALLGLLVATSRLLGDRRRSRTLLRCLVAAGVLQAIVAAVHLLQRNTTSVLGLYAFPPGWESGLGTFVNRNHAACLLLLTSGATAGLLLEGSGRRRSRVVLGTALGAQLLVLGVSLSRGALASAAIAGALLGRAALGRRIGRRRALLLATGASLGTLLLAVALLPGLTDRLRPLLDGSLLHYQKVQVWRDALPMVRDFWLTGVGRGAFSSVFPPYRTGDEYVSVPYAASLPLQQAADIGVPATLLLWAAGAALALSLWRRRSRLGWAECGTAMGLLAVLLHNLVDFGLELPGVAAPAACALGLVWARAHRRRAAPDPAPGPSSPLPLAAAVVIGVAAAMAVPASQRLLSLDKVRIRAAVRDGDAPLAERLYAVAAARHPADYNVALLGASAALLGGKPPQLVLRRTNRALELHPADAQAHRIAARVLAVAGRRDQAALELRIAFARGLRADEAGVAEASLLVPTDALPDTLPQHPDVQRRLADHLAARGEGRAALRARRRAHILDPGW